MSKEIKLIVTADDYGLSEVVDNAVLEAILEGSITTVTVLMNFDRSEEALKHLIQTLDEKGLLSKIGIGVHLNISTGYPVIKEQSLIKSIINKDGIPNQDGMLPFFTIDGFKQKFRKISKWGQAEIRKELDAQIKRFIKVVEETEVSEPVFIDHFTSQHNLLHQIRSFSKVIANISDGYKRNGKYPEKPIPVRRPIPMLIEYKDDQRIKKLIKELGEDTKDYLVERSKSTPIRNIKYRFTALKKSNLNHIVEKIFKKNRIKCPHAMFFSFFASTKKSGETKAGLLKDYLKPFRRAAHDQGIIKDGEAYFIEIVHHLGNWRGDWSVDKLKQLEDELKRLEEVSNLDMEYLQTLSPAEFKLVKSDAYKELLNSENVTLATFSDLNAVNEPAVINSHTA